MIKIIKSFRKTLSLRVLDSWEVILKAPLFVSKRFIDDFLSKHKDWLIKKQSQISSSEKILFLEWKEILFLWKKYKLIFDENSWDKIIFDWEKFTSKANDKKTLRELFINFYKKQSEIYFKERVEFFAKNYNLVYNNIKISFAKWKWGSCSSKKNLSFVYNLILANEYIIDYVIVHELAHTKQMNHSKIFWQEVENIMPNYKEHRFWLKKYWNTLRF